ncbi:MAG TPA: putative aminohydrolase SsnA [Ktedonobacteraceae bacterium]|jgi:putative selenium metabolism protein SsnA|nr:putative aminohydrolase SsnA [Ktedonobacteraceae bacterium]
MSEILIGNGTVVTLGAENRLIEQGAVLVRDNRIAAIDTDSLLRGQYPDAEYVDANGGLIMPSFLCSHTHFYSAFARGMTIPGEPPRNFLEILERLWWRLDKLLTLEDIRASAGVYMVDAIRHGTTCVVDHHASPHAIEGSLDVIADVVEEAGIRACLAYEVSDRDGPDVTAGGIHENERFIRSLRAERKQPAEAGMIAGSYGLHASFTLGPLTLERCAAGGAELGVGFHIHVAEDSADEQDSLARYGMRVVDRLEQAGILGSRTIAAHCVHVQGDEMSSLASTSASSVHNPRSNMNNAVGRAPVEELLRAGVNVGLGNDGFSMNMMQEMKTAYLLHKLALSDPRAMPADLVLKLAFEHNAQIMQAVFSPFCDEFPRVGELSVGGAADIILLDYLPPTPLSSDNFPWHLIFGMDGQQVNSTMVAGRWLMRNRQLLTIDEERIHVRARELSQALWKRL